MRKISRRAYPAWWHFPISTIRLRLDILRNIEDTVVNQMQVNKVARFRGEFHSPVDITLTSRKARSEKSEKISRPSEVSHEAMCEYLQNRTICHGRS